MIGQPLFLYIYNLDGQLQALIDDYKDLIWSITDQPGGHFELVVPYDDSVFEWAQDDNLIVTDIFETGNQNFMENTVPMIIDSVDKTRNEDEDTITISGKSFDYVLHRRVIVPMLKITGMYPSQIIWNIVQATATNPRNYTIHGVDLGLDTVRYLPRTSMLQPIWPMGEESVEWGPFIDRDYIGENLYDAIGDLCKSWNLGFRVRSSFTETGVSHVFYVTFGTDYSIESTENKGRIVLSKDISHIPESSHLRSSASYKNVAYIKGARAAGANTSNNPGEIYTARRPGDPTGYDLREGYIDGSSLPANIDDPGFPTENYKTILRMAAADYLYGENGAYIDVVEAEIYASYTLGKDYGLGDKVSLEDSHGDLGTAIVTAIEFTHNDSQRSLRPVFSFENRDILLEFDDVG